MIGIRTLHPVCRDSADPSGLRHVVQSLIGQPFLFFRVSYGDELRLHLGDIKNYPNAKMRNWTRGSFIVATRASSWTIDSAPRNLLFSNCSDRASNDPAVDKRVDLKSVETDGNVVPRSLVISAEVGRSPQGFSLELRFDDRSVIQIRPFPESCEFAATDRAESDDADGTEVRDWEILLPHERILIVGPGLTWSCLDSTKKRHE